MRLIVLAAVALTPLLAMDKKPGRRLNEAAAVFSEVMATPDRGIPQDLLERAHCIVIVPGVKTAAFIVGALLLPRCGFGVLFVLVLLCPDRSSGGEKQE